MKSWLYKIKGKNPGNADEIIGGIQDCIRIDSVGGEPEEGAPYGKGPKEALDFALQLGKKLGFRTGNVDNKAGYVEMGEGDEMIAVLGHLDVVRWVMTGNTLHLELRSMMESFTEEVWLMIKGRRSALSMQ